MNLPTILGLRSPIVQKQFWPIEVLISSNVERVACYYRLGISLVPFWPETLSDGLGSLSPKSSELHSCFAVLSFNTPTVGLVHRVKRLCSSYFRVLVRCVYRASSCEEIFRNNSVHLCSNRMRGSQIAAVLLDRIPIESKRRPDLSPDERVSGWGASPGKTPWRCPRSWGRVNARPGRSSREGTAASDKKQNKNGQGDVTMESPEGMHATVRSPAGALLLYPLTEAVGMSNLFKTVNYRS